MVYERDVIKFVGPILLTGKGVSAAIARATEGPPHVWQCRHSDQLEFASTAKQKAIELFLTVQCRLALPLDSLEVIGYN